MYSGISATGGVIKFPFSSTPVEPIVPVYSGTSVLGALSGISCLTSPSL